MTTLQTLALELAKAEVQIRKLQEKLGHHEALARGLRIALGKSPSRPMKHQGIHARIIAILTVAGKPMHLKQIMDTLLKGPDRARDPRMFTTTVGSTLHRNCGPTGSFRRLGWGLYELRKRGDEKEAPR